MNAATMERPTNTAELRTYMSRFERELARLCGGYQELAGKEYWHAAHNAWKGGRPLATPEQAAEEFFTNMRKSWRV